MNMRILIPNCLLVVVVAAFAGCAPPAEEAVAPEAGASAPETLQIAVSHYPLHYVVERIGGDEVDVVFPAADGGDPAYWKPDDADVAALQEADLIVINGATYEKWLNTVTLPEARVVDTTAPLSGRLLESDEVITHSHGDDGEHTHAGTAMTTWLDPVLFQEQADVVADALGDASPGSREAFLERLTALKADLDEIDAAFAAAVAQNPDRPVLFSHPVYQYLEARYGINGHSLHWEPGDYPTESMWADLEAALAEHPATLLIWEGEPVDRTVEALADMGIDSVVVDPCATPPDTGTYLDVMRANARALAAAYVKGAGQE